MAAQRPNCGFELGCIMVQRAASAGTPTRTAAESPRQCGQPDVHFTIVNTTSREYRRETGPVEGRIWQPQSSSSKYVDRFRWPPRCLGVEYLGSRPLELQHRPFVYGRAGQKYQIDRAFISKSNTKLPIYQSAEGLRLLYPLSFIVCELRALWAIIAT